MDFGVKNRRVFITASSSGIGFATAECFLKEGAIVILNGRNEAHLEKVIYGLNRQYENRASYITADILTEEGIHKIIKKLEKEYHGLDIFIGNLGNGKPEQDNPLSVSEWKRFYNINVLGNVQIMNALHKLLQTGINPNVVLVSSVIAREAADAPAGYAAAKSAVRILSKYLSRMWASDGIRVNCVLPGNVYFKGGRWEELLKIDKEGTIRYVKTNVPMKRFGKPMEIANVITFLASDRASFITGAEISIDGGQLNAM